MTDQPTTREQLLAERDALRRQLAGREQALQQLAESERWLRTLIDASQETILLLGADETILLANETSARRLGRPLAEILGRRPRDLMPAGVAAERIRHFEEVRRTGNVVRFEDQRAGRHFENVMHPIRDEQGKFVAVAVLAMDRTETQRAQEALQQARDALEQRVAERTAALVQANADLQREIERREQIEDSLRQSRDELRTIYHSLVDGLIVADLETGRFVSANPALCAMVGYSEAELLTLAIPDLHPPDSLAIIMEPLQSRVEGRLPGRSDVAVLRKDGSVFYADITGGALVYQGRLCSLGLFRDVTERRKTRLALERERRTLEHMLQASDHERQLIAYDIHDGLAQELAGAMMQFQVYEHLKESEPDEARRAYEGGVTLLRQGHAEARRLISGVRPPILDESGVMAAISHLIHDPVFDRGPKIEFRSRVTFGRLRPVLENVIYRIVQEGLSNARTHSRSPKILVRLVQRKDRLRIEIRDWGVGFDPKSASQDRFGIEGIRERARLLGGRCRIRSRPGKGSMLLVELPVVDRGSEP